MILGPRIEIHTAKSKHKCLCCRRPIKKGSRYVGVTSRSLRGWITQKHHIRCYLLYTMLRRCSSIKGLSFFDLARLGHNELEDMLIYHFENSRLYWVLHKRSINDQTSVPIYEIDNELQLLSEQSRGSSEENVLRSLWKAD